MCSIRYEIRKTENGALLRIEGLEDDGRVLSTQELSYQEPRDGDAEVEAFADFLRDLVDHWGPQTSRYSPKRIYIEVRPGDKYEPGDA
jgi:hypothetical protein